VVDANGRMIPTASDVVTLSVQSQHQQGKGQRDAATAEPLLRILGTANGDPACHTPDHASTRPAFRGLLLGIVQSVVGGVNTTAVRTGVSAGDVAAATLGSSVTVRAEAPGLTADSVAFRMIPDESGELWL
jgi:hypothetical protein